jgi:peroxiredoxin
MRLRKDVTLPRVFRNEQKLFSSSSKKKEDYPVMPEVGDMAPDFELKSHLAKDKKVKLSDFRGNKNVVLAFYPLAWTPV